MLGILAESKSIVGRKTFGVLISSLALCNDRLNRVSTSFG